MTSKTSEPVVVVLGAGYVGGELARSLCARGRRVVALTRNPHTLAQLAKAGVETVCAELGGGDWPGHPVLAGPVAAVAVTVAAGGGGVEGYRRSYVDGLARVLDWGRSRVAAGLPTGSLVYTGSTSVYPQGEGCVVTEEDLPGGVEETTLALLEAEKLALAWPGAGAVVLRLAGIYGPGRVHLLEQVRRGEVSGREDAFLNLIHRDDILPAIEAAWAWLEPRSKSGVPCREVFNLCDGSSATKGEIVSWLAARLGLPAPAFTGSPAGGRRRVTPSRVIDASKARNELSWHPRVVDYRSGYGAMLEAGF